MAVATAPLADPPARRGVTIHKNARNKFTVFTLHFSADPRKRTDEWLVKSKEGISNRDWEREYNLSWSSPAGKPVTPEFDRLRHAKVGLAATIDVPLLRWWDFGYVSPVVLFAQVTLWNQIQIFRELCPFNVGLRDFIPMVQAMTLAVCAHPRGVIDIGDPEGEHQHALGSITDVLANDFNIHLITKRRKLDIGYDDLRRRLLQNVLNPYTGDQEPGIVVDAQFCPNLVEAASGAHCRNIYPPYAPVKTHPEKDLMDAWRYGIDNLDVSSVERAGQLRAMATRDQRPIHTPIQPLQNESGRYIRGAGRRY